MQREFTIEPTASGAGLLDESRSDSSQCQEVWAREVVLIKLLWNGSNAPQLRLIDSRSDAHTHDANTTPSGLFSSRHRQLGIDIRASISDENGHVLYAISVTTLECELLPIHVFDALCRVGFSPDVEL